MRKFAVSIKDYSDSRVPTSTVSLDAEDLGLLERALRKARETAEPWELPIIDKTLDCVSSALAGR